VNKEGGLDVYISKEMRGKYFLNYQDLGGEIYRQDIGKRG